MEVSQALIVDATLLYYYIATDNQVSNRFPYYLVYKESTGYLRCLFSLILPIPLDLTLIADYIRLRGDNCSIFENILNVDYGYNRTGQYTDNSNGFAEKFEYKENGVTQYIINLVSRNTTIGFGSYFLYFSIISIILIIIIANKRKYLFRQKSFR